MEKLPDHLSKRIADKIESLSENPYRTAERCEGYPFYHQRVGAYRAILEIDDSRLGHNYFNVVKYPQLAEILFNAL